MLGLGALTQDGFFLSFGRTGGDETVTAKTLSCFFIFFFLFNYISIVENLKDHPIRLLVSEFTTPTFGLFCFLFCGYQEYLRYKVGCQEYLGTISSFIDFF
jgi:hypothetical protein